MTTTKEVLTVEQRKFYDDNGYLVVKEVWSNEECGRFLEICESYAEPDFRGIVDLELKDPRVLDYIRHPRIVELVEALFNAEVVCIGTQVLFKKPGTAFASHAWHPHQDNAYVEAPYGTSVSAMVPLVDIDPASGGLYVYPGSHREDLLAFEPHPSFDPDVNPGRKVSVPSKYKKLDLYVNKGDLYIQHGNLIHGSYGNVSLDRARPQFGIMYIVKDAPYRLGTTRSKRRTFITLH